MTLRKPFHAVHLRLFAICLMLLDHLWATVIPGNPWMHWLGRLAFPIFAFQTAEGYFHTSNFKRYALRLLIFGLISEIPYDLMVNSVVFWPFQQNVMFTLLLGLLGIHFVETKQNKLIGVLLAALMVLVGTVTFVDYGGVGVLTVLVFGLFRKWKPVQLVLLFLLHWFGIKGEQLMGWLPIQSLAVLSLPILWLYNGEKGPRTKWLQYGSYWFYPVHMLLLYAVTQLL